MISTLALHGNTIPYPLDLDSETRAELSSHEYIIICITYICIIYIYEVITHARHEFNGG